MGVSELYAADTHAGRCRPHPRHLLVLANLAGIVADHGGIEPVGPDYNNYPGILANDALSQKTSLWRALVSRLRSKTVQFKGSPGVASQLSLSLVSTVTLLEGYWELLTVSLVASVQVYSQKRMLFDNLEYVLNRSHPCYVGTVER